MPFQYASEQKFKLRLISVCHILLGVKMRRKIREKPGWCCFPSPAVLLCQPKLAHAAYFSASGVFLWFLGYCFAFLPSHLQQLSCWPPHYVKTQKWLRKHLNLHCLGTWLILQANAIYAKKCPHFLGRRGGDVPHLVRLEGMHDAL